MSATVPSHKGAVYTSRPHSPSVFLFLSIKTFCVLFFFSPPTDKVFTCVCCFIVFNVMDLAGRSAPSLLRWVSAPACIVRTHLPSSLSFFGDLEQPSRSPPRTAPCSRPPWRPVRSSCRCSCCATWRTHGSSSSSATTPPSSPSTPCSPSATATWPHCAWPTLHSESSSRNFKDLERCDS